MNSIVLRIACSVTLSSAAVHAAEVAAASGAVNVPIAANAFAGSSVNVVANVRHTLFTHEGTQYAGYYDADGAMVLAKRPLDGGSWEIRRTEHRGNVADAHNSISLVVDGAGLLHVAWDHHGNPLNYARAVAPGSLELRPKSSMTGQREAKVTYPQFFRTDDGDVFFLYRDGTSGRGALVLNRYSVKRREWSQVQPNLIDGEGARSPYWGMAVDRAGTLHLTWTWRESPDVATNHDLCYARSSDGGTSWTTSGGQPLTMPITATTAEYALRIPQNSNLMNSPVIETDERGVPHIMTYWSPEPGAPPQFQIVHRESAGWRVSRVGHPLTPFSLSGGGTKRPPISRGILLPGDAMTVVYRDDSRAGRILAVTSRRGLEEPWSVRELTHDSVGAWEPSLDPIAWQRRGELHMLVERVEQRDGNDRNAASVAAPIGVLVWKPGARR